MSEYITVKRQYLNSLESLVKSMADEVVVLRERAEILNQRIEDNDSAGKVRVVDAKEFESITKGR